jgi:hypothetical protein
MERKGSAGGGGCLNTSLLVSLALVPRPWVGTLVSHLYRSFVLLIKGGRVHGLSKWRVPGSFCRLQTSNNSRF